MYRIENLEKEIKLIKERNKKVEAEKAWEISWFRKILIATITYLTVSLFFYIANLANPFLNAFIPTIGFLLSTLTIPVFKKLWLKHFFKKQ